VVVDGDGVVTSLGAEESRVGRAKPPFVVRAVMEQEDIISRFLTRQPLPLLFLEDAMVRTIAIPFALSLGGGVGVLTSTTVVVVLCTYVRACAGWQRVQANKEFLLFDPKLGEMDLNDLFFCTPPPHIHPRRTRPTTRWLAWPGPLTQCVVCVRACVWSCRLPAA
jgi:hypothetical protein